MKKLEFKMIKGYNRIIALFLSLLGFAGCEDMENGGVRAEYGVPQADFIIRGTVQSSVNNQVIPNTRVVVIDLPNSQNISDTVYTDNTGKYEVIFNDFPKDKTYLLTVSDIDGATFGNFNTKDSIIEFKNPQFTGGDGHWYQGKVTKTIDIKLIPKN